MSDVQELNINNTTYDIKAKSVVDTNSGKVKFWTGTKAEYDAIATKDSNTLYNITDDADVTFQLLELIYPVGSIYIGTMSVCPLQTLGLGTWELVAEDRVLQGAGTRGSVGTTLAESLPNITGSVSPAEQLQSYSGVFYDTGAKWAHASSYTTGGNGLGFDASRSSSTYQDNAPVQQDAYLVNIWKRIS